jgi:pilin isopeptide linkage protein
MHAVLTVVMILCMGLQTGFRTLPVRAEDPGKYSLHLDGNGADTGAMDDLFFSDGTVTLPANAFTKEGMLFSGWSTTPDGLDTQAKESIFLPDQAVIENWIYAGEEGDLNLSDWVQDSVLTLYAQWQKKPDEEPEEPDASPVPEETENKPAASPPVFRAPGDTITAVHAAILWNDENNAAGLRPAAVTFQLYADGNPYLNAEGNPVTAQADETSGWAADFTGLPEGKDYTVVQTQGDRYAAASAVSDQSSVRTVTFTNSITLAERTISLQWIDYDNQYGKRPETVNVVIKGTDNNLYGSYTLTKAENWTKTVQYALYKNEAAASKPNRYGLVVDTMDNASFYETSTSMYWAEPEDYNAASQAAARLKSHCIYVSTTWEDQNNGYDTRPSADAYGYVVKTSGSQVQPLIMNTTNILNGAAIYVPAIDAEGQDIALDTYTVEQKNLPSSYQSSETREIKSTSNSTTLNYKFTNTLSTTTTFTANLEWQDQNGNPTTELVPPTVTLTLLANGQPVTLVTNTRKTAAVIVDTASSTYTWTNLPDKDAEGNAITYSVSQSPISVFNTTSQPTEINGSTQAQTIINKKDGTWKYSVDLYWGTTEPAELYFMEYTGVSGYKTSVTYWVSISTSTDSYDAETMRIRIPYALFARDDGSYVIPYAIGTAKYPDHGADTKFSYYIDKHDSENPGQWDLVLINWDKVDAGSNAKIPVTFQYYPTRITDLAVGRLQAALRINEEESSELKSNEITYRVDTGVKVNQLEKTGECLYNKNDYESALADVTMDTSNYNYVLYTVVFDGDANQDFEAVIQDVTPAEEGAEFVKSWSQYSYVPFFEDQGNGVFSINIARNVPQGNQFRYTDMLYGSGKYKVYLLLRYPRTGMTHEGGMATAQYHNTLTFTMEGADTNNNPTENTKDHSADEFGEDKNDISSEETSTVVDWVDYSYFPTGNIIDFQKTYYKSNNRSSSSSPGYGLTLMRSGIDPLETFHVNAVINGTYFGNPGDAGYFYTGDLWDKDIFWSTVGIATQDNYTSFQKMTEEDYYFTQARAEYVEQNKTSGTVILYDIDRTNGSEIPVENVENLVFTWQLYYNGAWHDAEGEGATFHLESGQMSLAAPSYTIYDPAAGTGRKDVTGIRIKYPEQLSGYLKIGITGEIALNHASENFKPVLEDTSKDRIYLCNLATNRAIHIAADGTKHLLYKYDPYVKEPAAEYFELLKEDEASTEFPGQWLEHSRRDMVEGTLDYSDECRKRTQSIYNNTAAEQIEVTARLSAAEFMLKLDGLDALYENMAFQEGTFYDLLPAGYFYMPDSATANGAQVILNGNVKYRPAEIPSVEVIDNFKGTGRQLVVFHVRTTDNASNLGGPPSLNYDSSSDNNYEYSGFGITYKMAITYQNYTFMYSYGNKCLNLTAFYKGLDAQGGSFNGTADSGSREQWPYTDAEDYETGSALLPSYDDQTYFYQDGDELVSAFRDINGDGDTTSRQVLYGYAYVKPTNPLPMNDNIYKRVKADSGSYSIRDVTHPGTTYDYILAFHQSQGAETHDFVFYDILENGENVKQSDGTSITVPPEWKGTLEEVKLVLPNGISVQPVIWYSTNTDLTYAKMQAAAEKENAAERLDIYNTTGIWSTTMPADKSKITAIAVDLRKDVEGNPFVFEDSTSFSVILTMDSPAEMPSTEGRTLPLETINTPAYSHAPGSASAGDQLKEEKFEIGEPVSVILQGCSLELEAMKVLSGRDTPLKKEEFSFTVIDENGEVAATGKNDAQGKIVFTPIPYIRTDVGTHTYTITEDAGTDPDILYDNSSVKVTVEVTESTDGSYALTAAPTYPEGGVVFTNKYRPVKAHLEVTKALTAADGVSTDSGWVNAGNFAFTLAPGTGKDAGGSTIAVPMPAAGGEKASATKAAPLAKFGDILFTQAGTYTYMIQETAGSADGVTYDTTPYQATVTVTEAADGTLSAGVSYGGQSSLTITNRFTPAKPQEQKPQEPKPQEPKPQEPKPQDPKPREPVPNTAVLS